MAFLIGGHPRSGTTLLFRLCRKHPHIGISFEFRCFSNLSGFLPAYLAGLQFRLHKSRAAQFLRGGDFSQRRWNSDSFILKYCLFLILRTGLRRVSAEDVESVLKRLYRKPLVGDKLPRYVFELDRLCDVPNLKRVILYRDGRDVVSSYLHMIRTDPRRSGRLAAVTTARLVGRQWVESIRQMEAHRDSIWPIRYEDLVRDPEHSLEGLSAYLGVSPDGFPGREVNEQSIGKFRSGLTGEELNEVMDEAGDTLGRLGYL